MKAPKEKEFRIKSMFYENDLHYHVDQYRNGKWRLVAGGFRDILPLKRFIESGQGEQLVKKMNEAKNIVIGLWIIIPAILIIHWLLTKN